MMSFFTNGYFLIPKDLTYHEREKLSFCFCQHAIENSLGLLIGGNVGKHLLKYFPEEAVDKILFSVVDNPMSNVAQVLFSNGIERIYHGNVRVDSGEPPALRMNRLRSFWIDILTHSEVKSILFNVNIDFDRDIETVQVSATEFFEYMEKRLQDPKWPESERFLIHR